MYSKVPTSVNFVEREKEVLRFWQEHNIFKRSIEERADGENYTFYDGLTILEGTWVTENYAIGCDKGNTQLVDAINKVLAELIADGTVQQIVDKYITAE